MENFADYILNETNLASKMEIVYYLSKKKKIYFDKSVIFKTELARMFMEDTKLNVDQNLVLTACLLCNCKKIDNAQKLGKLKTYALEGATYLSQLGFKKRFCKICQEVNRYSKSDPRERESDILELVDQFGGMLLDRPERVGFKVDEALVLLEHRNLKSTYNRYLNSFIEFAEKMGSITLSDDERLQSITALTKLCNKSTDVVEFIKKVSIEYEPKVDRMIKRQQIREQKAMFESKIQDNPNRPLFSLETTKKIMNIMKDDLEIIE